MGAAEHTDVGKQGGRAGYFYEVDNFSFLFFFRWVYAKMTAVEN